MKLIHTDSDTIVAISTALGEGAVGVLRLSGPEALAVTDRIFKAQSGTSVLKQKSHTVQFGRIVSGSVDGKVQVIDEVLVLVMRGPKSYTREDVVEISAHGGQASMRAILELALSAGARLAQKGEFTKRAFLNGRMDLLQAEAVLDLVRAKTDLAREWAAAQLGGVLSEKMRSLRDTLVDILSHFEAAVDFPDDRPDTETSKQSVARLDGVLAQLQQLLSSADLGLVMKNGLSIVIVGRPNVGKSSLMNQLAKIDRVIVTPYPGTTRDVVEEQVQIYGFPVRLSDTAGIQDTENPIEKQGIERSKKAAGGAELLLYVLDGSQGITPEDRRLLEGLGDKKKLIVINKTDLAQKIDAAQSKALAPLENIARVSCANGKGISELEDKIFQYISQGHLTVSDEPIISSARQKDILEKTCRSVEDARNACLKQSSPELVSLELRLALDQLGMLAGEVVTDDVLEALFSQFCIGK